MDILYTIFGFSNYGFRQTLAKQSIGGRNMTPLKMSIWTMFFDHNVFHRKYLFFKVLRIEVLLNALPMVLIPEANYSYLLLKWRSNSIDFVLDNDQNKQNSNKKVLFDCFYERHK